MNISANFGAVAAPRHPQSDFLTYEAECKEAMKPLFEQMVKVAEEAGWNRRTVASTLMFLAARDLGRTDRSQIDS